MTFTVYEAHFYVPYQGRVVYLIVPHKQPFMIGYILQHYLLYNIEQELTISLMYVDCFNFVTQAFTIYNVI